MPRKNPLNQPLRLTYVSDEAVDNRKDPVYINMLGQLAIAQATLARHKTSAMPHFIAIVKELEIIYGFKFEQIEPTALMPDENDENLMVEAKCPKCACKLVIGKALVHRPDESGRNCFGPPGKAVLEVVLKCSVCGYSITKEQ